MAQVRASTQNAATIKKLLQAVLYDSYPVAACRHKVDFPPLSAFQVVTTNEQAAYLEHCDIDAFFAPWIIAMWEAISEHPELEAVFESYRLVNSHRRLFVGLSIDAGQLN